jgi:hypothetical protein
MNIQILIIMKKEDVNQVSLQIYTRASITHTNTCIIIIIHNNNKNRFQFLFLDNSVFYIINIAIINLL